MKFVEALFIVCPRAVLTSIIFEWVDLTSLATLDTAVVSHIYREAFLCLIRNPHTTRLNCESSKYHNVGLLFWKWVIRRRISLREIKFSNKVHNGFDEEQAVYDLLRIYERSDVVQSLVFTGSNCNPEVLETIFDVFPNVTKVTFDDYVSGLRAPTGKPYHNSGLKWKEMNFINCYTISGCFLRWMLKGAENLQKLTIVNTSSLKLFTEQWPLPVFNHIHTLHLTVDYLGLSNFFFAIAEICPNVTEFHLTGTGIVVISFENLISKWSQLRRFVCDIPYLTMTHITPHLKDIEYLNLRMVILCDSNKILRFILNFTKLQYLEVQCRTYETSEAEECFSGTNQSLTTFILYGCLLQEQKDCLLEKLAFIAPNLSFIKCSAENAEIPAVSKD